MKAEYRRDLQNNYLVLEASEEKEEGDYSVQMAEQNRIEGLLPLHRSRMDGNLYLNYEVTGKQPLAGIFERRSLSREDIRFVLSGTEEVISALQKFLLKPEKLIFDPQYIFMDPESKKLNFCYAPGIEESAPISVLAEFLLKRLDHKDREAVMLGYYFYERTREENFSLQKSVREILREMQGQYRKRGTAAESDGYSSGDRSENGVAFRRNGLEDGAARSIRGRSGGTGYLSFETGTEAAGLTENGQGPAGYSRAGVMAGGSVGNIPGSVSFSRNPSGALKNTSKDGEHKISGVAGAGKEGGSSNAEKEQRRFAVHPAILVTMVLVWIGLGTVFFFGYLKVTETGGAFFLILALGLLANSFWKKSGGKKKEKKTAYSSEADEKDFLNYQELQREMYSVAGGAGSGASHSLPSQPETGRRGVYGETLRGSSRSGMGIFGIAASGVERKYGTDGSEKTQCLIFENKESGMHLVYAADGDTETDSNGKYPVIPVREGGVTVGKMKEQCDVLLDEPTISRLHARLEKRQERYLVKDLNSRNGTFVNGRPLLPQETREFKEGDTITFADLPFRAEL